MSHQIDSIAFTGELPWHGLGVRCPEGLDSKTFFEKAGLLWEPVKKPLFFADGSVVPDAQGVFRNDNDRFLKTVGADWTPFLNDDLRRLLDALTIDGAAKLHTAGGLLYGRRVWALLQCEGQIIVRDGDVLAPFLLVSNAHDATRALRVLFTTIRVVCANTERLALSEKTRGCSLKHTSQVANFEYVVSFAREALGLANASFEEQANVAIELADARFDRNAARAFFAQFITGEDDLDDARAKLGDAKGAHRTKLIEQGTELISLFESGRGNRGNSKWDAFNAVTEFLDHQKNRSAEWKKKQAALGLGQGLESSWFGAGAEKKERALRLLRAA